MNYGILFFVFLSIFNALHAEYVNCGDETTIGSFSQITVSGCTPDQEKCILHSNTNASITIEFTTNKSVEKVKAVVHGIIKGVPLPFPLPNPQACEDSGLTCPLSGGKDYTYKTSLPVYKSYPRIDVTIKWELKSNENEQIICVLIPAKIRFL